MRIAVTGRNGQVATALRVVAAYRPGVELVALSRPELDLDRPQTVGPAILAARPDVVISSAAYTAVDAAEQERDAAFRANAQSAGELASAARRLGAPVLHLSTDYVFDGVKPLPYVEDDETGPLGVYGASKLAGEVAVIAEQPESLVLRTAWVYGPSGRNFMRTMLAAAQARDEIRVVADQHGSPTSAEDIADALLRLAVAARDRRGVFGVHHMVAQGSTTWAGFAEAILQGSARRGAAFAQVVPITTSEFPTAAARPKNSRLDCAKLERGWAVKLPSWRDGLERALDQAVGPVRAGATT